MIFLYHLKYPCLLTQFDLDGEVTRPSMRRVCSGNLAHKHERSDQPDDHHDQETKPDDIHDEGHQFHTGKEFREHQRGELERAGERPWRPFPGLRALPFA